MYRLGKQEVDIPELIICVSAGTTVLDKALYTEVGNCSTPPRLFDLRESKIFFNRSAETFRNEKEGAEVRFDFGGNVVAFH